MQVINFRFNSLMLGLVAAFFLAVAWPSIKWAQELSGFQQGVFFMAALLIIFNLTDALFLVYFKIKESLWGWKKIDWTFISWDKLDAKKFSARAVAEYLTGELSLQTVVLLEGIFLNGLYIRSRQEYFMVYNKFLKDKF